MQRHPITSAMALRFWGLGGGLMGLILVASLLLHARSERRALARPSDRNGSDYVGSPRCRSCHGDHYASWHRTYHRRMTAEVSRESVLGEFSGQTLDYFGVPAVTARGPDGGYEIRVGEGEGAFTAQVVRTVGSHRYQQYLARDGDLFIRLPIAWDVSAQRFIHMNGAFLTPDPSVGEDEVVSAADFNRHVVRWNDNCIFCHNVAPNPGADGRGHFASSVAELGVACEACHGPGGDHVRANRNPVRRYLQHLGFSQAPDVTAPSRLPAARSAEVCGRCHGQRISRDIDLVHREGDRFVPGEPLARYSKPLFRDSTLGGEEGVFAARFWSDGTPRLTAYEYQGYLQSPCAADPRFDCGSCHSMHTSDPAGQLRADRLRQGGQDGLCLTCHADHAPGAALAAHSQHDPAGPGARCVNCHMPTVVYGLVRAHRSHRITVPTATSPGQTPDACGLCHVRWDGQERTRARAQLWPEQASPPVADSLALADLLFAGDPVERSVAAAALARPGTLAAGLAPERALSLALAVIAFDDYPAVREIARRGALQLLEGRDGVSTARDALTALQPTARKAERTRVVQEVRFALPSLPGLDEGRLSALRARAQHAEIAIGE